MTPKEREAFEALREAAAVCVDLLDKWKRTIHGADFFEPDRVVRAALAQAEALDKEAVNERTK